MEESGKQNQQPPRAWGSGAQLHMAALTPEQLAGFGAILVQLVLQIVGGGRRGLLDLAVEIPGRILEWIPVPPAAILAKVQARLVEPISARTRV